MNNLVRRFKLAEKILECGHKTKSLECDTANGEIVYYDDIKKFLRPVVESDYHVALRVISQYHGDPKNNRWFGGLKYWLEQQIEIASGKTPLPLEDKKFIDDCKYYPVRGVVNTILKEKRCP